MISTNLLTKSDLSMALPDVAQGPEQCSVPGLAPPPGRTSNFEHADPTLVNLAIGLSVGLTALATCFTGGRLVANRNKLAFADALALVALLVDIAGACVLGIFAKYFRHMWDFPLCWVTGRFHQLSFTLEVIGFLGLFLAKSATLLLFYQIFTISPRTRLAICIGLGANLVLYTTCIIILTVYGVPRFGQTWGNLVIGNVNIADSRWNLYWGVAQAPANMLLDVYIFILPLPIVSRIKMSRRSRVQVFGVFFTGLLAVASSMLSVAFRIRGINNIDRTWNMGILLICNFVEMDVATIIASAPGFAAFMRQYIIPSRPIQSLLSLIPGGSRSSSEKHSPNQPRTGRDNNRRQPDNDQFYESWLLDTQSGQNAARQKSNTQGHDLCQEESVLYTTK
ncbi:hypothetical protein CDD81_2091 [Ophiocordyceps australis]|uniref:Rhodopsin domain-containing protein n=1 Tax=Ophiocordyceps australis TaxID=1399860 RepID=A0A2C5XXL3_9HYPO|nr:hypothetical protein CDD81_2091 [Ophiocordyceps australis]